MIKALPVPVIETLPIAEAISSAGGIRWSGIDDSYMLKSLPGTFAAGEMLDWEAPTGGYLLTAWRGRNSPSPVPCCMRSERAISPAP
ncbi:hypothetical protein ACC699_38860, partial [Rhizobium ruizarguesonis]